MSIKSSLPLLTLILGAFTLMGLASSIPVHAATTPAATPAAAGTCPSGNDEACSGALVCNPDTKQCIVDPKDNLFSVGDGPCDNDDDCRGNTTECNLTTNKCEYSSDTPDNPTTPAASVTPTPGNSTTGTGNFIPLTNLPVLQGLTTAPTLPAFFNALYKYCIGIAVVLTIIQLIHAGIIYMGGDSVTEVKTARTLIGTSLGGLLLVLSPVIVFGIINPNILQLNVGFGLLAPTQPAATAATPGAPIATRSINATSAANCQAQGGTVSGDATNLICTVPENSPAAVAATACTNYQNYSPLPSDESCTEGAGDDYIRVSPSCCPTGMAANYQCCAQPVSTAAPAVNLKATASTIDFVYQPVSGDGADEGPTPGSASTYNTFKQACTASKGTLAFAYGKAAQCNASNLASNPQLSKTYAGYLFCTPTTLSCNP